MIRPHALAATLAGAVLGLLPLSGLQRDAQAPSPGSQPILDFWVRDYAKEDGKAVGRNLKEFADYIREEHPDIRFSVYKDHGNEEGDRAYMFLEGPDSRSVDAFWSVASEHEVGGRVIEEWEEILPGKTTRLLRQIAGLQSDRGRWGTQRVVHWSVRARFGKSRAALAVAETITEHVNQHYDGVSARCYVEYFRRAGTVHWFFEVPGGGNHFRERFDAGLLADDFLQSHLEAAADLFVEDSFADRWLTPAG